LRETKNGYNRHLLLNSLILNGPGEAAVHERDVGGEGVTHNAVLREGRPRISDHI